MDNGSEMKYEKLHGKVLWLTGASSGLGEALALLLGQLPMKLALSARSKEKLESVAERIRANGRAEVLVAPLDVTDFSATLRAASEIEAHYKSPVDIFISCAGTYTPSDSLKRYSAKEHTDLMTTNYFSLLYGIEGVLPSMLKRNTGQIIGVGSVVGYFGLPRSLGYSSSKAAMITALQSLRMELSSTNIQVKVINPGFVKTPLTDKNDFSMPFLLPVEDAARRMLASLVEDSFECHFPKRLSLLLKFLRLLPFALFEWIIKRVVFPRKQTLTH